MRSFVKVLVALAVVVVPVRAQAQSATVTVQNVALRDKPADDGKMLWQLSKGDNVTVLSTSGAWTRVRLKVTKGWVPSSTLEVTADKAAPASHSSAQSARSEQRRTGSRHARGDRPAADRNGPLSAFREGDFVLGPAIGLGGVNGTVALGGELEKGIKTLPELGNGGLGISAQLFYYHYSTALMGVTMSTTAIPFGAAANYHFALKDQRFDPFVGAGLGYTYASASVNGGGLPAGVSASTSGVFFWGRVGARYFVKPNLALHGDVGVGAATLNVGVMFRP